MESESRTVTEFTQLTLRHPGDELEFLEAVIQYLEEQDEWVRRHQPARLMYTDDSFSSIHIDKTTNNTPTVLIVASWDSIQAHQKWLNSRSHQRLHQEVSKYVSEKRQSTSTRHLKAAGRRAELPSCMRRQGRFTVGIFHVERENMEDLQSKYDSIEKELHGQGLRGCVWAAWELGKNPRQGELVVFWDQSVPSKYTNQILAFSEQKIVHHYRYPGHDSFSSGSSHA
ncbi:hypothetical protein N3K66_007029 [Trichothecium roseum]|uniref:Uncharacterized protein n=1 Tax=Trichothecium roseum TaxID=47278 RepID=A0ACC0UX40_9HYPO|nr:hypothetical protein N3K66_007029 [Trichothecium roseum]